MTKYLVMDVDGTLTDGKIYMGALGELMKAFNVKDGCGMHDILIPVIIIGRYSDCLVRGCKELGVKELYQGESDKLVKLKSVYPI